MNTKFVMALVLAGFFDFVDFLVLGFIPLMGKVLNLIVVITLFPMIGIYSLVGFS